MFVKTDKQQSLVRRQEPQEPLTTAAGVQLSAYTAANAQELETGDPSLTFEEENKLFFEGGAETEIRKRSDVAKKNIEASQLQLQADSILANNEIDVENKTAALQALSLAQVEREARDFNPMSMEELFSRQVLSKAGVDNIEARAAEVDPEFAVLLEEEVALESYIASKFEKQKSLVEEQGIAKDTYDFVLDFFALPSLATMAVTAQMFDSKRADEIKQSLLNPSVSIEEKRRLVDEVFDELNILNTNTGALRKLEVAFSEDNAEKTFGDLINILEAAPAAGVITRLGVKGAKGVASKIFKPTELDITLGNRTDAVNRTVRDSVDLDAREESKVSQTLENLMPSTFSAKTLLDGNLGVSGDVAIAAEKRAKIVERLETLNTSGRLDEDQLQIAIDETEKALVNRYGANRVLDVQADEASKVLPNLIDDNPVVRLRLGSTSGAGYASRKSAQEAARKSLGLKDYEVTELADGKFAIDILETVDESKIMNGQKLELVEEMNNAFGGGTFLRNQLLGTRLTADPKTSTAAQRIDIARDAIADEIISPFVDTIQSLGRKSRNKVATKLEQSHKKEKWFSQQELLDSGLNTKEIDAYYAGVQLNNLEFFLRERTLARRMKSMGMRSIETKIDGVSTNFTGKVVDNVDELVGDKFRVGNVAEGTSSKMTKEQLEAELANNKVIVTVFDEPPSLGGGPVKHLLVNKGSVKTGELPTNLLKYRAGGHRFYQSEFFVKKPNTGTYADGDTWVANPTTLITSGTRRGAEEWVSNYNKLSAALKEMGIVSKDKALEAIEAGSVDYKILTPLMNRLHIKDIDELVKMIDDKTIEAGRFAEVVRDGDMTQEVRSVRAATGQIVDLTDPELRYSDTLLLSTGKSNVTKSRGEWLRDPHDQLARIVEPFEAIDRGLNQAVNTGLMLNFQESEIRKWIKSAIAAKALPKSADASNPIEILRNPNYILSDKSNIRSQLEQQRAAILRTINTGTEETRLWTGMMNRLADYIEKGKVVPDGAPIALRNIGKKSPVAGIKQAIFESKLGMFNPTQLLMQSQTAITASAIDAKHWLPAMRDAYILAHAKRANWDSNATDVLSKAGSKATKESLQTQKEILTIARDSGFISVGSSIAQLTDSTPNFLNTVFSGKIRNASRFFFNEGDRINRSVALSMAIRRIKEQFPKLDVLSNEGRRKVIEEAQKLSFNMTRGGASGLQTGVLSPAVQFRGFQMRFFEALLSPKAGFTKAERIRMGLAQALFYGSKNLPIVGKWIQDNTNTKEQQSLTEQMLVDGFYSTLVSALSGGEIDADFGNFSAIAGGGDLVEAMLDENTPFKEVILGPMYSVGKQLDYSIESLYYSLALAWQGKIDKNDIGLGTAASAITSFSTPISSLNRSARAYLAYTTGKLLNTKGDRVLTNDINKMESVLFGLTGVLPSEVADSYRDYKENRKRSDKVQDMANTMTSYMVNAFTNGDSNQLAAVVYLKEILATEEDPLMAEEALLKAQRMLRGRLNPEQFEQMKRFKGDMLRFMQEGDKQ